MQTQVEKLTPGDTRVRYSEEFFEVRNLFFFIFIALEPRVE